MSCSNGQVWSSKWPRRSLTKPVKLGTPRALSALPGVSESGHEAAWPHRFAKKSGGLKVIDLANIMHKAFAKASNYTINRPEKLRYPGHIISLGIVTMLHVSSAVSPPCASYVEANSDIAETENSDRHWFSDHLGAGKVMTSTHCKLMEAIHNTEERACCCLVLNKLIHPRTSKQFVLQEHHLRMFQN